MSNLSQVQSQRQKQIQKLSQVQIQGISFLEMNSLDLRSEIYKAVAENPALKIVSDKFKKGDSEKLQRALENTEDYSETLQEHLLHQLMSMKLSEDEISLSEKLIYNLDENGFYGSSLAPEFLLDKKRPLQTSSLLKKCIERIQQMDPVGTCCKNPEESLFVQAKINGDAPELVLFILDGHLDFLNPPEPVRILEKLEKYLENWHKKAFAPKIILDDVELSEEEVENALKYVLHLNPRPAQGYIKDTSSVYEKPDVVVEICTVGGRIIQNDYSRGLVRGNDNVHFQIKYASGILPDVTINQKFLGTEKSDAESKEMEKYRNECIQKANEFLNNLKFRENTIILQACAIVNAQRQFFLTGTAPLESLTRRQIAKELNIHESSVSRTSNKKNSKFFQTEYGLLPASYFFVSGVSSSDNQKVSSSVVKQEIKKLLEESGNSISDQKITDILNSKNIKISRRTVNKYRNQM